MANTTLGFTDNGVDIGVKYIDKEYAVDNYADIIANNANGLSTPSLWAWGHNSVGQLGLNDTSSRSSPVQVGSLTNWKSVSNGCIHTIFIKTDGTLWSCGEGYWGDTGLNSTANRSSPTQVGTLTNWKRVYNFNTYSNAAIKTDGTLWAWGMNINGNLGLGNASTNVSSPTQVGSLTNWKEVGGSTNNMLAIKTDGTLWAWGDNGNGQLGLNDLTARSSPTQVGTLTNWKLLGGGGYWTSRAIKTDGTLWAWGGNNYGQLGLNDYTYRSSPTQVGTLTNWKQVSNGYYCSCAIKTDGTLWAWGRNNYGQLGLNDVVTRSSPVQVGSLTNWKVITSTSYHVLAIQDSNF